jgi:hypothetical protein
VAIYTVFRQLGSAVGIAAWVAAIGAATVGGAIDYRAGWWIITGLATLALVALAINKRSAAAAHPKTTSGARPSRVD